EGPHRFIEAHAEAISTLVNANNAVALLEWKGTGMSRPGDGRGRTSFSASLASSALMVGEPLAAEWVETIRWVLYQRVLRSGFVAQARVVLGADTLATPNPPEAGIVVPHDCPQPRLAEPLAATLASVLALDRPSLKPKAIIARGGLVSYRSVLDSPFVHVP